jgi:hypothetical protein
MCHILSIISKLEAQNMKERVTQIILILIAATLLSSCSILRASALETSNTENPVVSVNSASTLRIDTYGSNGINNSIGFSIDDIYAMPKTTVYADLSCYGRLVESGLWGGVSLRDLLAEAGYTDQIANLQFFASDGYSTSLTISEDTSQNVIVAYDLEGNPLLETLRLVIPDVNGAAWISRITLISINSPTPSFSPNPDSAHIIATKPRPQQSSTIQPSPTPQPTVQPTPQPTIPEPTNLPQPTIPEPTNQPAQLQESLNSSVQNSNLYPMIIGAIAVAAATLATGYLFYKHRK